MVWRRELLPPGLKFLCIHRDDRGRWIAGGYDGLWMRDPSGAWAACPMRSKGGYAAFVHGLASSDGAFYAISTNGTVNTSVDGVKWTGRKTGIKHDGKSVVALGGGCVVAFAERGRIAISDDHAKTFTLGESMSVDDAWFDRLTRTLYAVGYQQFARSTDGGGTWTSQPWDGVAQSVYADGRTVLISTGEQIVRSEDDGVSWSTVFTTEEHLTCLRGFGREIFAVGSRGIVVHSRDGGITWAREDVGLFADLTGVFCADDTVMIVGDDSVVLARGAVARESRTVAPQRRAIAGYRMPPARLQGKRPAADRKAHVAPPREQHCARIASLVWSDDDTLISLDDAGRMMRWAGNVGIVLATLTARLDHLAVFGDLVIGIDDGMVRAHELATGAPTNLSPIKFGSWTTQLARRGDRLFALDSDPFKSASIDPAARTFVLAFKREGRALDVDATGERFLGSHDGKVHVRGCADDRELAAVRPPRYLANAIFGGEPDVVIVQDSNGKLEAIDTRTNRRRWRRARVRYKHLLADAAYRFAAGIGHDGSLDVIELATGKVVLERPASEIVVAAISSTARIAIGHADGRVIVQSLAKQRATEMSPAWQPSRRRPSVQRLVSGPVLRVARDGGRAVVVCDDRALLVDLDRGGAHDLGAFPLDVRARDARLSLAGDTLLAWDGNAMTAIAISTGEIAWSRVLPIARWIGVDSRAYMFQGHSSYGAQRVGHTMYRLDLDDGSFEPVALPIPEGSTDANGYGSELARIRDGLFATFRTEASEHLACVFDPSANAVRVIAKAWPHGTPVASRCGRYLASCSTEEIVVCELDAGSITARITIGKPSRRGGVLRAPAIDPVHDRIAAIWSGELCIWNARGELVGRYTPPIEVDDDSHAAFSEDGETLVLFGNTGVVQVGLPAL